MSKQSPQMLETQCIVYNGHRIYWHGQQHKACRAYTDERAASATKRVEAKPLLRKLARDSGIIYGENDTTDQIAAKVFGKLKAPGWDSKAISRIARNRFGGYAEMFKVHGWPETGKDMMPQAGARITERYGSIEAFVKKWARN